MTLFLPKNSMDMPPYTKIAKEPLSFSELTFFLILISYQEQRYKKE